MENVETTIATPEVAIEEGKIKKLIRQFSKFFVIGVINTLVDIVILNIETIATGAKSGGLRSSCLQFSSFFSVVGKITKGSAKHGDSIDGCQC